MGTKFEANCKYSFGFIGDADLKAEIKVIKRTEKTITIFDIQDNVKKRCKIFLDNDGNEFIFPLGRYSMCPVAKASKKL